jgi:YVTN family beta-propeller protein
MSHSPLREFRGVKYTPSNENIYVINSYSDDVSVIDSSTNTVVDTINVGMKPYDIEFNPSNNNIYIANMDSNTVSVVDSSSNTVVGTKGWRKSSKCASERSCKTSTAHDFRCN